MYPIERPTPEERLRVARRLSQRPIGSLLLASTLIEVADGKCPMCRNDVGGFASGLALAEYMISGLCQVCQDQVFNTHEAAPKQGWDVV